MSIKIIAGVLEESADTKIFAGLGLCEPVLSLNVVAFLFVGLECRSNKRQLCVIAYLVCQSCRTEIGAEYILLLSVKIYTERLYVFACSESCLAVFGIEVVVVVRDVAQYVYLPTLVGLEREVCLIVDESGSVLAFGVERSKQIACCLVSHAIAPCKLLVAIAHINAVAQQACIG